MPVVLVAAQRLTLSTLPIYRTSIVAVAFAGILRRASPTTPSHRLRRPSLVERVGQTARSPLRAIRNGATALLRDDILWSANFRLAALPDEERAWLAPHLRSIQLPLGRNCVNGFDDGDAVYFPITAVISVTLLTEDGRPAEMAVVGRDGLIGRSLWPSIAMVPVRMVVQHEGQAVR
ncbi:hypothetical protein WT83_16675 [Burkholderia territorii]|uniref:Uncharacterized protein n=1 Tax=Burkholderia territorii TaxID=1503055 RepID=A0A108EPI0_9BURK|nr:hypothetical protein WT83_16675 [Burkholderia territorii]